MRKNNRTQYLEEIAHITGGKPFSLHTINFCAAHQQALYLHLHPEMELFYLEHGELNFYVEDTLYHMKAGDAIFIPPNLLHHASCASSADGVFHALVFSPDVITSPWSQDSFVKYVPSTLQSNPAYVLHLTPDLEWHRETLADLERIFTKSGEWENSYLLAHGLILVIWQYLCQYHISKLNQDDSEKGNDQLQAALQYIHEHYFEEISLPMLADTAHMSPGYFCRFFKQRTHYTPFTYLKRYRIFMSCSYLTESDKKISEICLLCGFNNISHYNREFVKMLKMTPSKYRKITRNL